MSEKEKAFQELFILTLGVRKEDQEMVRRVIGLLYHSGIIANIINNITALMILASVLGVLSHL